MSNKAIKESFNNECDQLSHNINSCKNRIANLQWLRNALDFVKKQQYNVLVKNIYKNYIEKNKEWKQYEQQSKKKLKLLISQLTPKCIKIQKRVSEIFSFFKFFIVKIYLSHSQKQNNQLFRSINAFNSILCLATDIFNFANNSPIQSYKQQCQYFEIPLIEALIPINWIGKNIQKPTQMNNYLYLLEKKIFMKQIWDDQTGQNLIKQQDLYSKTSSIGYKDLIVWNRLQKHVLQRARDIMIKLEQTDYITNAKTQMLIRKILRERPMLLHKCKIDKIIICSIIKLNQKQNLDPKQLGISQFYSQVFLPEVNDLFKEDQQNNLNQSQKQQQKKQSKQSQSVSEQEFEQELSEQEQQESQRVSDKMSQKKEENVGEKHEQQISG